MLESELYVMSRVIGHSAVAGALPAGGAPFQRRAAEAPVPAETVCRHFEGRGD